MSTENPSVSNFKGLEGFDDVLSTCEFRVFDGNEWVTGSPVSPMISTAAELIPLIGVSLRVPADITAWERAASGADIDLENVSIAVITEDSFLKERNLVMRTLNEIQDELTLAGYRKRRHRSMMNRVNGISIEVAAVLSVALPPQAGRPHRKGTRLASTTFSIRPHHDAGGLNPIELTEEVIKKYDLRPQTVLFVEAQESLLEAEDFADSVRVHVNGDVLRALAGRRSGREYDLIGTNLAVSACQQLAFLLAADLNAESSSFAWTEGKKPVLDFIFEKAKEFCPKLRKADDKQVHFLKMLRETPTEIAAGFSGMEGLAKHTVTLLVGTEEEV